MTTKYIGGVLHHKKYISNVKFNLMWSLQPNIGYYVIINDAPERKKVGNSSIDNAKI